MKLVFTKLSDSDTGQHFDDVLEHTGEHTPLELIEMVQRHERTFGKTMRKMQKD